MNVVGKLGVLIIKYQYGIEVFLLSLLAFIFLFLILRAFARMKRKKEILNEINDTLKETKVKIDTMEELAEGKHAKLNFERDFLDDHNVENAVSGLEGKKFSIEAEVKSSEPVEEKVEPLNDSSINISKDENTDYIEWGDSKGEYPQESSLDEESSTSDDADKLKPDIERELRMMNESNEKHGKYFTRDCATDRYGNVYTEEALINQIK